MDVTSWIDYFNHPNVCNSRKYLYMSSHGYDSPKVIVKIKKSFLGNIHVQGGVFSSFKTSTPHWTEVTHPLDGSYPPLDGGGPHGCIKMSHFENKDI